MSIEKLGDVFSGLGHSIKQQIEATKKNILTSNLPKEQTYFLNSQLKSIEKGIKDNDINEILTTITKINDTSIK